MDINLVREVVTVVSLVLFLGIVVWAYRPSQKQRFKDDGMLVFSDTEPRKPV